MIKSIRMTLPHGPAATLTVGKGGSTDQLRELVHSPVEVLRIKEDEWQTLNSIQLPGEVSKDGYVQLLITIRAIAG